MGGVPNYYMWLEPIYTAELNRPAGSHPRSPTGSASKRCDLISGTQAFPRAYIFFVPRSMRFLQYYFLSNAMTIYPEQRAATTIILEQDLRLLPCSMLRAIHGEYVEV